MSIVLLFISGQVIAEEAGKTLLEDQNYSRIVDSSGTYAGLDIIDLDELMDTRGGFSVAGLDLTFGATLRTLIDNIKFETVFNITKAGAEIVSQVLSDVGSLNEAMAVTRQAAANNTTTGVSDGAVDGGTTAVLVGPGTGISVTDLAPADISLEGLSSDSNFSGVVVSNNQGFTAALHRLTQNAAISAIVSNASNQRVSQKLDIKIAVANTGAARSAAKAAALSRWADSLSR